MMPECADIRTEFSDYLDGELAEADERALEKHLQGCDDCRRELQMWRQTLEGLHNLPARRAPEGFAERLQACLHAEEAPARGKITRLWPGLLAAAGMLLVGLGVVFFLNRPPERDGLQRQLAMDRREERGPAAGPAGAQAESTARQAAERRAGRAEAPLAEAPEEGALASDRREAEERETANAPQRGRSALSTMDRTEHLWMWRAEDNMKAAPASRPAEPEQPPQQIVNMQTADPVQLMQRVVTAARRRGVGGTVSFSPEGAIDVYLRIPPEQYDPLMQRLAVMTQPASQSLSNTVVAKEDFFRMAAANYERYQLRLHLGDGAAMSAGAATADEAGQIAGEPPPSAVRLQVNILPHTDADGGRE